MYSMTGYGRADYTGDKFNLTVEIRTVNNKNLDLSVKSPRVFASLEDAVRKAVSAKISRGHVDLYVNFTDLREKDCGCELNTGAVKNYIDMAKTLKSVYGIDNDLTSSSVLRLPDVLKEKNEIADYSFLEKPLVDTVNLALDRLNEMRKTEGEKLSADMLGRVDTVEELLNVVKTRAPFVATDYAEKLKKRIAEALNDVKYDEARLLNEVAFFTDKSNIDEEMTRLSSHISQFRELAKEKTPGKKLDFLMQEFNRETNTICSKANDITVTQTALSMKNEIEKIREQVQNIE